LNFVGGVMATESFLGIPYDKEFALTTINDVNKIYNDFSENLGNHETTVILSGFGKGLMSVGEVASGFSVSAEVGSESELNKLAKSFNKNNIYVDYDVVNFSKSGNGFSVNNSSAKSVTGIRSYRYEISPFIGCTDDSSKISYLLKRSLLEKAVNKIIASGINAGIGLSTLSSTAYSDYSNKKTYARARIESQVSGIFSSVHKKNICVMGDSANSYAAENCDFIKNVPLWSDGYNSFDTDVPFYSIVYKGHSAMSGTSLNVSGNLQADFLRCLETGIALQFSIIGKYDAECLNHFEYPYAQILYDDNKKLIETKVVEASDFLKSVLNTEILQNEILSDNVRYTEFTNGCRIVVNYNDTPIKTEFGEIEAKGYIWERQ
jgi:hypothetical protein